MSFSPHPPPPVFHAGSGDAQQCNNRTSGVSIKGESSSSSESDSSSGSDSESESTSSESEQNKPSGCTSPEPEQPTANKWQLDKWLNKVNPNRSCILSHAYGLCHTGIKEVGKSCEKVSDDSPPSPADKEIQSLSREEQKLPTACVASGNKGVKQKSSAPIALVATVLAAVPSESKSRKRPICRQLTRRTERTSSGDNVYCHSSDNAFLNQGILGNNISEQPKTNLHRKEPRTGLVGCEIRRTRALNKFFLKTKEFESSSHYSDHGTETELEVSPLSKNVSDTPVIASENNHRLKESENNNTARSNQSSDTGFVNARTTELEEQYYTLVPFGRNENIHSLKGSGATKSLWVRIDLSLLSRIPVGPCQETCTMNTNMKEPCSSPRNRHSSEITDTALLKSRRKRKSENGRSQHMKKKYLEKEEYSQMASSLDQFDMANAHSTHINSLAIAMTKSEKLLLSPTSPLPDVSKHKCTNDGLSGSKISCGYVLSASRNRRTENQSHHRSVPIPSENSTGSNAGDLPSNEWSHISNGHKESRKSKSLIGRTPRDADYFMQEAKRMKHKADAMMDKSEKMMNYTEAALSFIECGNAMEHGPMESKSPYTMYSETVELIRYALRLKSHSGPSSSSQDKKITALCYRCLALLYWRMFRLKKDHAVKYSKALIDYFKNTSKVHQVPSSRCANGKTTGTPSPLSPSPSPVSSVGSQGSISSAGGPSNTSIISIPQRIHQMAANHVSITNSILHSYDYWEIADNLAKDNIDFFNKLDALMGPVTLHSSMEHLVQYTRQGLRWVRHSTQML
ncbi:AF4/FMR2 family member 3 [Bombina bombina]|uniref:AF4/FMR2 family member 3 n=1 Tax=Bombina bombina TaxID=8345 RepID=UPI00235B0842|nr:AF4/FMR2 family member 3 [Bombina bombina]